MPLSQTKVTTRLGVRCARQYFSAAASRVPVEEPARIASLLSSSRAVAKLSASVMVKASRTSDRSQFGGTKSSPMPSTSHEPAAAVSPVATLCARIEPLGSARIMATFGATRSKKRPMPVSVPPEPTPTTTASTSWSICSQISGPVPCSWASGLAGLPNWLT